MGLSTIKLNVLAAGLLFAGVVHAKVDTAQVEQVVVRDTNEFRKENGIAMAGPDPALRRTAEAFAAYMARTDEYGHEADGRTPGERAKRGGYDWCRVTENISYQWSSHGFETAELARRLVEGWKKSPGHRRNMLDPKVTETAVAVARSAKSGKYYAVQMFGRPRGRGGC
jgi:uncharacterized protein YkwD